MGTGKLENLLNIVEYAIGLLPPQKVVIRSPKII